MHIIKPSFILLFLATWASAGESWPRFRGPEGDGHSDAKGLPLRWSETENVTWKTAIHGCGHSSPVVWEDQIWMTTATEDGKQQYAVCVDRATGRIIHDVPVFHNDEPASISSSNTYATPTPVIEAGRVYVHFGTYGTACLDTGSSKVLWTRRDIHCDHQFGPGSSPVLVDDMLIFPMDGMDVQYVIALNKKTGQTAWKKDRNADFGGRGGDYRKAYCTPSVIDFGGRRQLISTGAAETLSLDPASGKQFWKIRHGGWSNTMSSLFGSGILFIDIGSEDPEIWAVRPTGQGDITDTHVVWKLTKNAPMCSSPVLVDGLLFMVDDHGVASCVAAATGEVVWKKRLGGSYWASPIAADGHVYYFNAKGLATVIAAGREFRQLAVNKLDEGFVASPAVTGKAIFLRTKTHLYRVQH
jgi:outer membrane protein assembly factor BamB